MLKVKKIVLITLLISLFTLVACNEKENIIQISGENKEQEVTNFVYDADYEKNVEKLSYETEFGNLYSVEEIVVPFINIKSENATIANNEIKQVFNSAIDTFNKGIRDKLTYVDQCNYKACINEDKLSVVLVYGVGATDIVYPEYYVYNFDLRSGNVFSYEDAYTYTSFNSTNINENVMMAIKNKLLEMYGEALTEGEVEDYANSSMENYINSLKDNTIRYFIDEKGSLNVIVTLKIPAGRGEKDTIITVDLFNSKDSAQSFNAKDYEGSWRTLDDINKNIEEDGGSKLTIKVKDSDTIDFEYTVISSAPFNRIAQINLENIKLDDNHSGSFTWEDAWNNKGKGTVKLDSGKVIINITDTKVNENAMWGIFDGEITFTEKNNNYTNRNTGNGENLLGEVIDLNIMDFLERTKSFFNKQEEIKGDRLREEFSNIRLVKKDKNYELKADLLGDVKIETEILEKAVKEITENKLEELEIQTVNGESVIIYSKKPQEIIELHERVKNSDDYEFDFNEVGVPTYYDEDWIAAKDENEWLNADGNPMYVKYNGEFYKEYFAALKKEEDGYYLLGRELAGMGDIWNLVTVNEKNSVNIKLLPTDKIILDINDFYHNLPDDFKAKELTVEEYYNLSPKDGSTKIIEDNLAINISSMSGSNYYGIGLEIKDGAIHVIARCDGP